MTFKGTASMLLAAGVILLLLVRFPLFASLLTGLVRLMTTESFVKEFPALLQVIFGAAVAYAALGCVSFLIGTVLSWAGRLGGNSKAWPAVFVGGIVSTLATFPALNIQSPTETIKDLEWFREFSRLVGVPVAFLLYLVVQLIAVAGGVQWLRSADGPNKAGPVDTAKAPCG